MVSLAGASPPGIPDNCSLTRKPPEIPDSCLPARSQEFAPVCTGPKRLTEDPVLPSAIRHQ